jgi:hypothetical protein
MSVAGLVQKIGIVALVVGGVGFFLPGEFLYFPALQSLLTKYGDLLFSGISANPMVQMLIIKAPVIFLALIGFALFFWGTMKSLTEAGAESGTPSPDPKKAVKELAESARAGEKSTVDLKKSASEFGDIRKK